MGKNTNKGISINGQLRSRINERVNVLLLSLVCVVVNEWTMLLRK